MPTSTEKIKAFEYLTDGFIAWHKEVNQETPVETSFNKLKLIKLLFFASAVDADSSNDGLLVTFDNYYALPFGHVESTVYDHLNELEKYTLNKHNIEIRQTAANYFDEINHIKEKLDNSINSLRNKNNKLVTYPALDLVELSHKWYSWRTTFNLAKSMGKFSLKIPGELIKKESKIYSLSSEA